MLQKINAIVHPKVAEHFERWVSKQDAPYVIKEVAILFETKSQDQFDLIITVTEPTETRIQRVIDRDQKTKKDIESIIDNQLAFLTHSFTCHPSVYHSKTKDYNW